MRIFLATSMILFLQTQIGFAGSLEEGKIQSLFKDYPRNETLTLSNGAKLSLPVHYYQIAALVTLGTVDLKKTQKLMKGTGLYPLPVSEKEGLAIIYMVDHTSNSIGKYREFVTLIAATSDENYAATNNRNKFFSYRKILSAFFPSFGDSHARATKDFFFYVPFISVTTEDALLAGREIWNLPKQIADFDLSYTGAHNSAKMKSPSCNIEFIQSENHHPVKLPLYMDFNLVGFWNKDYSQLVKAPMLAKGTGYLSLFDRAAGDLFFADPNTECGDWISQAEFKPKAWQYVPRSGAVLFDKATSNHSSLDRNEITEKMKASSDAFVRELERVSY